MEANPETLNEMFTELKDAIEEMGQLLDKLQKYQDLFDKLQVCYNNFACNISDLETILASENKKISHGIKGLDERPQDGEKIILRLFYKMPGVKTWFDERICTYHAEKDQIYDHRTDHYSSWEDLNFRHAIITWHKA